MIGPATYNIVCPQGATFELNFTWTVDGVAVDLTGGSAKLQVRETYSSTTYLYSLTSPTDIVLGGAAGTVAINIQYDITNNVAPGNYVYDFELTLGTTRYRLLQGKWQQTSQVTQS